MQKFYELLRVSQACKDAYVAHNELLMRINLHKLFGPRYLERKVLITNIIDPLKLLNLNLNLSNLAIKVFCWRIFRLWVNKS